jgi:hypothetical protein
MLLGNMRNITVQHNTDVDGRHYNDVLDPFRAVWLLFNLFSFISVSTYKSINVLKTDQFVEPRTI